MTRTRTDIFRPSVIVPSEYEFVSHDYIGPGNEGFGLGAERKIRRDHMHATGGHEATHEHGGTCEVCGALAFYVAWFYHAKSKTYVMVGEDCAAKLEMGDANAFKTFRKVVAERRKAAKGKAKASQFLADAGVSAAWDIYAAEDRSGFKYEEHTIYDIVSKLVRYGSISEPQTNLVRRLLDQIPARAEREARQAAESEAASPVPVSDQRVVVVGEVLTIKTQETRFGFVTKMLVKADAGWKVWGSVPASLDIRRGNRVSFEAKIEVSREDPKFGFYSRPSKAVVIAHAGQAGGGNR